MSKKNRKKEKKPSRKQGKPNYAKLQRKQVAEQPAAGGAAGAPGARSATQPESAPALLPATDPGRDPGTVVTLEPLAPIIVRSGRPFDFQAGADAARFPPPSTLAGCLRTAWARETGAAFGPQLAERAVAGPLLMRVDADDQPCNLLVPKPADAQYFGHGAEARCLRAEPGAFEAGCGADLPEGLQPVRLVDPVDEKASQGPQWWGWNDFIAWRSDPRNQPSHRQLAENGWSVPAGDRRTHVAIDPATGAADAGRLFQTEGLDLAADNPWLREVDRAGLQLLARFSEPLSDQLVHLGGERRLARLHPQGDAAWPEPPEPDWFRRMRAQGGLTLSLLTPAILRGGYRPGWLDETLQGELPGAPGVRLQLVSAALERWQPHSGWDLHLRAPRATRKLVAAGATYWFRLLAAPSDEALAPLWLASLCDSEQDRRDGYGLTLPAPWTPTV